MESFATVRRAKTIIRLIDLKVKRESLNPCPYDPDARCDVPTDMPCAKVGCPMWLNSREKANEEEWK